MKIDNTGVVAVDPGYHWHEDMSACPKGVKVQLLTRFGCAHYGIWTGKDHTVLEWAPLPTRRKEGPAEAKILGGHGSTRSTREYSGALYALADRLEQCGRLTADGAEMLREAAQRLDEQTIAINVLRRQIEKAKP